MTSYVHFFAEVSLGKTPHGWQKELAESAECSNRLIRIPTGFGKTLGVLSAWLWNRLQQDNNEWPRRLVWCLPMRVLVEQTADEVRLVLSNLGLLWDQSGDHKGKVGVHLLMGGADCGDWHLYPEESAVLIGTQDMLLSRAMNRGFASPRARWPMEFGLLNHDALWIMDEVQLMDVGLASSAQLQTFRENAGCHLTKRPCSTWWMSATLQKAWLEKSPDTAQLTSALSQCSIPKTSRVGYLWSDVSKPCRIHAVDDARTLADLAVKEHTSLDRRVSAPTLIVLNTVRKAVEVFELLTKDKALQAAGTEIKLIHSRFRPAERARWRKEFVNREACGPGSDRIIVSTQVIEAGVDISASLLVTELAPWASLVQRFGRAARWGGSSDIIVADLKPKDDKASAPYGKQELDAAREALALLPDVSPLYLEAFEDEHPELLPALYPYNPAYLLLQQDIYDLFDTTPDLSGADIDISRFIRSDDERDVQVFWADIPERGKPSHQLRPSRESLCSVPYMAARNWLCGKNGQMEKGKRAWVWDWLPGEWRLVRGSDIYPGQTLLVAAECGGYDFDPVTGSGRGWFPASKKPVLPVPPAPVAADELADAGQDDESLSVTSWKTIATHGLETGSLASEMARVLVPDYANLLSLAGRVHDVGKAHPRFQAMISAGDRPVRVDLAKAPQDAWSGNRHQKGFRHELASAVALFSILKRHKTDHPALLGPWRELLTAAGMLSDSPEKSETVPTLLEKEILDLDEVQFNLLAFLICTHHGKVRTTWHTCSDDQAASDGVLQIRGIREYDALPELPLFTAKNEISSMPTCYLDLAPSSMGLNPRTGQGWTERVLSLLDCYGPFALAWLEAVLRAADQRASAMVTDDALLGREAV